MQKIAAAEVARVQAETVDVQNRGALKQEELRIKEQQTLLDAQNKAEKLQLDELTLMMKNQDQQRDNQAAVNEAVMKGQESIIKNLNVQANTLKTLREAMGVDVAQGPHTVEAFVQQAETITEQQDSIQSTPETDDVV